MRTPAGGTLVIPARGLAEAIAEEWSAQDERVVPATMPLMQLMATALDRVAASRPGVIDQLIRYGETDREAFERLNHENTNKPEALRVRLREENGRYLGYFGEGGTRSGLYGPDRPGPILLQGDHGPVAYRNILIKPL